MGKRIDITPKETMVEFSSDDHTPNGYFVNLRAMRPYAPTIRVHAVRSYSQSIGLPA